MAPVLLKKVALANVPNEAKENNAMPEFHWAGHAWPEKEIEKPEKKTEQLTSKSNVIL